MMFYYYKKNYLSFDFTKVYLFIFIFFTIQDNKAQNTTSQSTSKENKSEKIDSVILKTANNDVKSKVVYKATDSIVFNMKTKKMYLYNQSNIDYEDIHIDAYYIDYDWTTGNMVGDEKKISDDSIIGKPFLKQADKEFYTDKLIYNFKSQKGKIYDVVTEEGDGFLHGHEVKKQDSNSWFVYKAKFTTCNLEDPHFYIASNKAKLITKKVIIAGASNLMIHDVPVPIYLPFGIFPLTKGRRSGILLPTEYGITPLFNMRNLGFYFAINDYMELRLLSDIYLNGSYDFRTKFNYVKKYKYTGEISAGWNRIFTNTDADNPGDRAKTPANYKFNWTHMQDIKAHPTFNFNANLSFQTQGYYNRNPNFTQNTANGNIQSNIRMTKRFRNSPFNITGGLGYNQDLARNVVSGDLVQFTINYNDNPFKVRKNSNSFWNLINLNYNTQAIGKITNLPDSLFFTKQIFDKLNYGIQNSFSFSLSGLKLFHNFNLAPTFNLVDRNYFQKISINSSAKDTSISKGFYNVVDFNLGTSLSTTLSGIFLFGQKGVFRGIKHLFTPTVGFSYSPNFSNNPWNYYSNYIDTSNKYKSYYPYNNLWSYPSTNINSVFSFGIRNSIEGKFRKGGDTSTQTVNRAILENLSFGGTYNFGVDSNNLSNFELAFSNSSLGFFTFGGSLTFDPYKYVQGKRTKYYLGSHGNFLRMTLFTTTFQLNLSSHNFSKNALNSKHGTNEERNYIYNNYYNFYDFNSPWNFSLSLTMGLENSFSEYAKRDTSIFSSSINIRNFDFNLTKHWKLAISTGYDFNNKEIGWTTISAIRDMHCWEFRVKYTPISKYGQGYTIEISPKASILQDLKLSRNKPSIDNYF